MLQSISPIDGRYADKTAVLQDYFSEYALIKYRIVVEVAYLQALSHLPLPQLAGFQGSELSKWAENISLAEANRVKEIEQITNHDVKAIEYAVKEQMDTLGMGQYKEFVHFGLTSQDINNTATPLMMKHALEQVYLPALNETIEQLTQMADAWSDVPMLARTHGQPASPTRVGKELRVFVERLNKQKEQLQGLPHAAKFGGATGNFNAHHVAYPDIDWQAFADTFVQQQLGLSRSQTTTQIEHYDFLAAQCHALMRINTICIDLCHDLWMYISMEYFNQKVVAQEVGSSAMPHKVNPIDFENAEGNLGLANAIFAHLAEKLPVSRLQRDLTDSTVSRNLGVPMAHSLIALTSIRKGLGKLLLNEPTLMADLSNNWAVISEAIQSILRREGVENPYEILKAFSRGKGALTADDFAALIEKLKVSPSVKQELRQLTPHTYIGI